MNCFCRRQEFNVSWWNIVTKLYKFTFSIMWKIEHKNQHSQDWSNEKLASHQAHLMYKQTTIK